MTAYALIDTIGQTPIVHLRHISASTRTRIFAKLEARNPSGSTKDRPAEGMIHAALESGHLTPSGTLVEPTSGNMGIAFAMLAAHYGFSVVLTMPETMSVERRALLKAYGAHLILTPANLGMAGAVAEAKRLATEKGYVYLDQFANPANALAHYTSTGPELMEALGNLDLFVAGVGTGGTVSGVGAFLKERMPVRVVALEPAASPVLSGGTAGPHMIQGIGAGFVPTTFERAVVDEIRTVTNEAALLMTQRLFKEEGISCGISSGANVAGALALAATGAYDGGTLVTVLPDTGERYLSTALFENAAEGKDF